MARINGCYFPEEGLLYEGSALTWLRFDEDGWTTSGITQIAQKLAGRIVELDALRIGTDVTRGEPVVTLHGAGPAAVTPIEFGAPLSGRLIEVNELALELPDLVNDDCYDKGWLVRIKPSSLDSEKARWLAGSTAIAAIAEKMNAESWSCGD